MQATIDETETKSKAQLKSVMDAYDKLKEQNEDYAFSEKQYTLYIDELKKFIDQLAEKLEEEISL